MKRKTINLESTVKELEELMYSKPKCDFEHTWNCALDKAIELVESFDE